MQNENLLPPLTNIDTTASAGPATRLSVTAPVSRHQRLVLERIELENFKSYAGKVVVGPFHEVCARPNEVAINDPSALLSHHRPKWFRKVKHHRCDAVRIRTPSSSAPAEEGRRLDTHQSAPQTQVR